MFSEMLESAKNLEDSDLKKVEKVPKTKSTESKGTTETPKTESKESSKKRVIIVGAGLVGSLEAIYLSRMGYQVDVYERSEDSRKKNIYQGRSINLAMSDRGFLALETATGDKTLVNKVLENGVKMYTRYIHMKDGTYLESPYGTNNEFILSIDRRYLNEIILSHAEKMENTKFHFQHKCITLDLQVPKLTFFNQTNQEKVVADCDILVGCDGAHSQVRSQLQKRIRGFTLSQNYVNHSYKELSIPPTKDGKWALDHENSLHIWPRGDFMLIALPNPTKEWTLTLFMRHEGSENSFEVLNSDEKVMEFFKKEFPDVVDKMPDLLTEWKQNKTSGLMYAKCYPFNDGGKTVLLGDSAHPIIPFYGQGVNAGFEDCLKLNELLQKHKDTKFAFEEFSKTRKPDVDAISDLSHMNFIEMSSANASKIHLFQRKIGQIVHRWLPSLFTPLYTMVAFRPDIGYRTALDTYKSELKTIKVFSYSLIGTFVAGATYAIIKYTPKNFWGDLWNKITKK